MSYSMLDVFKVKENTEYSILNIEADLFLLWDFAVPVDFYNDNSEKKIELNMKFLVRSFYPDRFEYTGITVYIFTKEQFERTFERVGTYQEFMKAAMEKAGVEILE